MSNKRRRSERPPSVAMIVKRLRRVASAMLIEAARCEVAAAYTDNALHAKNAAVWRSRSTTCHLAADLLEEKA